MNENNRENVCYKCSKNIPECKICRADQIKALTRHELFKLFNRQLSFLSWYICTDYPPRFDVKHASQSKPSHDMQPAGDTNQGG